MKTLLTLVAVLGIVVASGSVSYYYLVLLPQQNADISAIRAAVAPTPQEVQAQLGTINAATNCIMQQSTFVEKQCPFDPLKSNYSAWQKCTEGVRQAHPCPAI